MPADSLTVHHGLPARCYHQAAEICYEAFERKFSPFLRSSEHGIPILEASFNPDQAMVALYGEALVGVVGMQVGRRTFLDFKAAPFIREFGRVRGLFKFLLFLMLDHPVREGVLFVDNLAVAASMRGKGVGTRLLEAVFAFAREGGFHAVALDVVDTNPGARRLYERMGFMAVMTQHYPYLRGLLGFSAVVRMVKLLD